MIKVAAAVPQVRLAQPMANAEACLELIREAHAGSVNVICFPLLTLTGYTAGDLLCNALLIDKSAEALKWLARRTSGLTPLAVVGLPLLKDGKLYNAMAFIKGGRVLGYRVEPNPSQRWFSGLSEGKGFSQVREVVDSGLGRRFPVSVAFPGELENEKARFKGIVLCPQAIEGRVGAHGSVTAGLAGLTSRCRCTAVLASAGKGESSTDYWYPGFAVVAQNGLSLYSSSPFCGLAVCGISTAPVPVTAAPALPMGEEGISADPFMCCDTLRKAREAFAIQCGALRTRLEHTGIRRLVIGVSGGLDSTLALLACARTLDSMGLPRKNLVGITMPGFGTTDRTYSNAVNMMKALEIEWREINIKEACLLHLRDIGHDPAVHDSAYENAQARERTQILMDVANETGALVVGTGDLSELALGWCTYNGDHMSMYAVNGGIPKTAIQHIIRYVAENELNESVKPFLFDVIDTPISPELLPGGTVTQKTEDIIGPYRLHDFFIWHFMGECRSPREISELAAGAFAGEYSRDEINRWLKLFLKRFFSQQFKRSCMPDGPDVFGISLSPRGGWTMPSDVSSALWTEDIC
ncbi:MAG: NAD(+) synthase [Bacteroidaceae bacterium]|nr:NAD(+) synthase [Bacteroidaceae bacterium]